MMTKHYNFVLELECFQNIFPILIVVLYERKFTKLRTEILGSMKQRLVLEGHFS